MWMWMALAHAAPVWNWPGETVYFHAETQLNFPQGLSFQAFNNLDAKANDIAVSTEFGCTAKNDSGLRILTCQMAWAKVTGDASRKDEQEKLKTILEEWSTQMSGYRVEMEMGMDGKLQQMSLENTSHANQRESFVVERQRLLLLRVFCLLDLPLAKNDKEWESGWKERGWLPAFVLINTTGTVGAMRMNHQPGPPRNGYSYISSEGTATVTAGNDIDANNAALLNCTFGGNTLYDASAGMLVYRDFVMEGQYTASAQINAPATYQQSATIQRINAPGAVGSPPPSLPKGPLP